MGVYTYNDGNNNLQECALGLCRLRCEMSVVMMQISMIGVNVYVCHA